MMMGIPIRTITELPVQVHMQSPTLLDLALHQWLSNVFTSFCYTTCGTYSFVSNFTRNGYRLEIPPNSSGTTTGTGNGYLSRH
jgi:hypothetical protein